jgi:hypothetical protein
MIKTLQPLFITAFTCLIYLSGVSFSYRSDCPENQLTIVKDSSLNMDIKNFPFKTAYGNFNKTYNSYRAIFINYDRELDSDFGQREGEQVKVIIMVFNMSGAALTTGDYTLSGGSTGNQFAVGIETAKGTTYAASYMDADIGKVVVTRIDDEMLCGEVNITDSRGMVVKGTFSVENR